jgi:hypothetical protein
VRPVDPGPSWPVVGVTGIPRVREWDAVVTAEAPALGVLTGSDPVKTDGDAFAFVALEDGRVLPPEAEALAVALDAALPRPYRAEAVRRRGDLWAAGAHRIDVVELEDDPGGSEAELVWDGVARSLRVDGTPSLGTNAELEAIGRARSSTYVVFAKRLAGPLWAVEVTPL